MATTPSACTNSPARPQSNASTATAAYDIIAGTGSSDTLDFSATELTGIAQIDGGLGNDAITGSAPAMTSSSAVHGSDNLNGGAGDDVFLLSPAADAGYDRFEGGDGADIVQGGSGDDTFRMYQFTGTATVEKIDGNGGIRHHRRHRQQRHAGLLGHRTDRHRADRRRPGQRRHHRQCRQQTSSSAASGSDNLNGGAGDDVFLLSAAPTPATTASKAATAPTSCKARIGDDTFRLYQYTGTATVEKIDGNGGIRHHRRHRHRATRWTSRPPN
jgi:Ca2+-binding RTX toxin-like protein